MKKVLMAIWMLFYIQQGITQTAPTEVGHSPTDTFNYKGIQMPNYWLKWTADPWYTGGSTAWLSGWAGIKFFTAKTPRMSINISGYVAVGTDTPRALFHVAQNDAGQNVPRAPILLSRYWASGTDTRASSIFQYTDGINDKLVFSVSGNGGSTNSPVDINQAKMVVQANGNVGIGTTSPSENLSVAGNMSIRSILTNTSPRPAISSGTTPGEIRGISHNGAYGDDGFLRISAGGGTNPNVKSFIDISGYMANATDDRFQNIILGTSGTEKMRIDANGNVGIGIPNPTTKLAVNGTISTKEVNVTTNGWPDYVFKPSYQLPSLEDVSTTIRRQGHLPDMPSAEEVATKGLNLGEINKLQQQKIEELTLYMIEEDRKLKVQAVENNTLKVRLDRQAALLEKLEQEVETLKEQIKTK